MKECRQKISAIWQKINGIILNYHLYIYYFNCFLLGWPIFLLNKYTRTTHSQNVTKKHSRNGECQRWWRQYDNCRNSSNNNTHHCIKRKNKQMLSLQVSKFSFELCRHMYIIMKWSILNSSKVEMNSSKWILLRKWFMRYSSHRRIQHTNRREMNIQI